MAETGTILTYGLTDLQADRSVHLVCCWYQAAKNDL